VRAAWGPLSTETVDCCRAALAELAQAIAPELVTEGELHRDAERGFLLLAHRESEGRYRPPHDHGVGWVIYAVVRGEIEMGSWARIDGRLVRRSLERLRAGDVRVYLPGDIHDTRALSADVVMLRFLSRDLHQ
jgi:predicted metal-dependent enzyme (double-stranded beta helix superfamily)